MSTDDDVTIWDRRPNEDAAPYAAFRIYRDLPPSQRGQENVAQLASTSVSSIKRWSAAWDWAARAQAWDDVCHQTEDRERLDAIRDMHAVHRRAGRAALDKATQALAALRPNDLTPGTIARLLELGAKLERSTLIVSVEELQGLDEITDEEDPWEKIARELDPLQS